MRAVFLNVGYSIFFCLPGLYFYLWGHPFCHTKSKASAYEYCSKYCPWGLYFHGKVIGMLVIFLGYKILILVFLGSSGNFVLYRNEILVFLGLLVFHIE